MIPVKFQMLQRVSQGLWVTINSGLSYKADEMLSCINQHEEVNSAWLAIAIGDMNLQKYAFELMLNGYKVRIITRWLTNYYIIEK